jgi:hypothetical protein
MKEVTYEEFREAYHTIMAFIDTQPDSRGLFQALVNFHFELIRSKDRN